MELINLTPYVVEMIRHNGHGYDNVCLILSSGHARYNMDTSVRDYLINGKNYSITSTSYKSVTGLPDPIEGTYYIVDPVVAILCKNRDDLYVLGTPVYTNTEGMGFAGFGHDYILGYCNLVKV
jgi:hypothetical protein